MLVSGTKLVQKRVPLTKGLRTVFTTYRTTHKLSPSPHSIFPNGPIGIIALIFAIVGYLLGATANNSCFYVSVDLTGVTGLDIQGLNDFGFGLWSREDVVEDYCVPYNQDDIDDFFDATWKAARAMAVIANICGGVTMIITICLSCVSIPKMFLNFTTFLSAAAGFFESLTFIAFSSDICQNFNCNFAWGAACAIGAIVVYFFNACLLYSIPEYEREESDRPAAASTVPGTVNPPPGSVSVTQTVLPDGTKKTIRTTINAGKNPFFCVRAHRVRTTTLSIYNTFNADGSKTVEETIEHPVTAAPTASAKTY